jgi:polysaccharide deacetylase family protein (PEP-CTERM system associated)
VSALTIDVEDYFQVSGFEDVVPRASWGNFESRVERETDRLLEILDDYQVSATFFMLGWTAERHPALVRRIQAAGHELACHSYAHRLVYECTREEFRADTHRAKGLVEDLAGAAVIGYRAPSFSITRKSLWALEVLAEEGFLYDSSIFPILRDRYGIPTAPRFPFRVPVNGRRCSGIESLESVELLSEDRAGRNSKFEIRNSKLSEVMPAETGLNNSITQQLDNSIVEFPPSTLRLLGLNLPIGGGGYLRMFPQWAFHRAINQIVDREEKAAILYIHPWELDPTQPRFRNGSRLSRFRQYVNLKETEPRLRALLNRWRFTTLRGLLTRLPDVPVRTL